MDKILSRKRNANDQSLCKYGASCYRKNPEHLKKFKHIVSEREISSEKGENENTVEAVDSCGLSKLSKSPSDVHNSSEDIKKIGEGSHDVLSRKENPKEDVNSNVETVGEILKSMPEDFFDFWKLCCRLNKFKPEDAFIDLSYKLVGVYDLLAKKLQSDDRVNISCHWRYFYDTPEFQTVIKRNDKGMFHIGYFRDDPTKMPSAVVSNHAAVNPYLKLEGDNIFAAMSSELSQVLKSNKSDDLKLKALKMKEKLQDFANEKGYSLKVLTNKIKQREKRIVARTFHGFGIVVPFENNIGYRTLPVTKAGLKSILNKIVTAETKEKRLDFEEPLDMIIANVNFANDECDYGMGLELGTDLFCYGDISLHNYIASVLSVAYELLNRHKYAAIIKEHLKNRRKDSELATLV